MIDMARKHSSSLGRSLAIQWRIVYALIMREIITRYGRHNIGFAWLFAEPMLFTVGIVILWATVHGAKSTHDINVAAFAITSYSTVLVWRNIIGRCTVAIEPNAALLYHRNVKTIDFFWARIILEIGGLTISMVTLLTVFIVVGLVPAPHDILMMAMGWALLIWYSSAMGLLIGGLCGYSELVERLWHPIAYFQLPVSGAFAMAGWLSPGIRKVVLLFPASNCVELFRAGYFGPTVKSYYDISYVCVICLIISWLGLLVVRDVSSRMNS